MATSPLHHDTGEQEMEAAWIVRKLAGSMTGRIVMSSYESLRATGNTVICLSPWGDSSPFSLPCIRFRDLVVHTVVVATGGVAAVAAPAMGPAAEVVTSAIGDSIVVEAGINKGFEFAVKEGTKKTLNHVIPIHSQRLETTGTKELLITLRFKHVHQDAALGFYRSSVHPDSTLFSNVKEYLAVEKGWFSPYLYASARRPVIPRNMKADIIFCHGPFLQGDYRIGETLLAESALVVSLCGPPGPTPLTEQPIAPGGSEQTPLKEHRFHKLAGFLSRSRSPSPSEGSTASSPPNEKKGDHRISSVLNRVGAPTPESNSYRAGAAPDHETPTSGATKGGVVRRRMVIVLVGMKPHRRLWTTSARPAESLIKYVLCNGCPAIVVPVKTGAPLVAWDCLTLEKLWELELPATGDLDKERIIEVGGGPASRFQGVISVIFEFLDLCVDWDRVELATEGTSGEVEEKNVLGGTAKDPKTALKEAIGLLLAGAIRTKESKEVKEEIDEARAGIAMWRIL